MGKARNPHVRVDFDHAADAAAVSGLGIDVSDAFVFAFAEQKEGETCKQIKTAVVTASEYHFDRLLPLANAAGLKIPEPIVQHVEDPQTIFLEDCCLVSRDVQVIALAPPDGTGSSTVRSLERQLQSVIIVDNDQNEDPTARGMIRLRISPKRVDKDCSQL